MMKKAFTLIELMIVIIIVGLLAGLALPNFLRTMELQRLDAAKRQIEVIKGAIELIRSDDDTYSFCEAPGDCDTTAEINAALDLDIYSDDFNFRVTTWAGSPVYWTWITAVRQNGLHDYELSINYLTPDNFMCYASGSEACDFIKMTFNPF